MQNIFVVGLDPFNLALLEGIAAGEEFRFHALLTYEEAVRRLEARFACGNGV
jgi:hypothetical protein